MSHAGYRKLEKKIMQDGLKKLEEAAKLNPSIVIQAPPRPPRHRKWKEGRRIRKSDSRRDRKKDCE